MKGKWKKEKKKVSSLHTKLGFYKQDLRTLYNYYRPSIWYFHKISKPGLYKVKVREQNISNTEQYNHSTCSYHTFISET